MAAISFAAKMPTSDDKQIEGQSNGDHDKAATQVDVGNSEPDLTGTRNTTQKTEPDAPFSIYTVTQKKFIVFAVSMAALLSPLSSQLYLPALNQMAADLQVSDTKINLTITTYLVRPCQFFFCWRIFNS
jgi:hypothetical protein